MMMGDACIIYIIYLLLDSYNNIYFFYVRKYFICKKSSLLTTTTFKSFTGLCLRCSRLFKQVTTKLLHFFRCLFAYLNINVYISIRYVCCSM